MIQINNLHKSFGPNHVLKGVELEIPDGKTLTIIGGSGSGKSVLFKHLIGLMRPDRGEVVFNGVDIAQLKGTQLYQMVTRFGLVFQGGALFDSLTVGENVAFGLAKKLDRQTKARIVADCLAEVGLPGIERLMPAELSGGMKKRVSIARVIARKPEIVLYDEPTTGLDPIMADVINNLIIKVSRDLKKTAVVITHDMVSAYKISDIIAVLYDGRIIETGTPDEIRGTRNDIVRQFIEGQAEGPIKIR